MRPERHCIDCHTIIDYRAKRCPSCAIIVASQKRKGQNHWNYKDGRTNNKEHQKEYHKQYYSENKKRVQSNAHLMYLKNKEQIIEKTKEYAKKHRTEINEWSKIYRDKRFKNDIGFKLLYRLRSRIWEALKLNKKSVNTIQLIGCTIEQLKQHLERKFTEGMSWSNYGEWHVDHIRPCALFDLSQPDQQKICFNYTNLQPLWAIDNLSKGAKIDR